MPAPARETVNNPEVPAVLLAGSGLPRPALEPRQARGWLAGQGVPWTDSLTRGWGSITLEWWTGLEHARGTDGDLVVAAQGGDREAFGRLYERFGPMVHGVLLARVPYGEVDDLVQEVFLAAFQRLSTLRAPGAFGAWLAAIARNRAVDYHRRPPTEPIADDIPAARRAAADRGARRALRDPVAARRVPRDPGAPARRRHDGSGDCRSHRADAGVGACESPSRHEAAPRSARLESRCTVSDEYLWNRSGEPDPDVERLERLLGALRHRSGPLDYTRLPASIPSAGPRWRWRGIVLAAAACSAVVIVAAGVWWRSPAPARPAGRTAGPVDCPVPHGYADRCRDAAAR